jgi:hypothetical protein
VTTDTLFTIPDRLVFCTCGHLLQRIPARYTYTDTELAVIHADHLAAAGCELVVTP